MAIQNKAFFSTTTQAAIPRLEPDVVTNGLFLATGSIVTYVPGTLLAWVVATGTWQVWDGNGSALLARIDGVVYSEVITSTAGEIVGAIMTRGAFHYNDVLQINTVDNAFGTAAELRGDLQIAALKERGLRVIGLKGTPE